MKANGARPVPERCARCGSVAVRRVKNIAANGAEMIWDQCRSCGKNAASSGLWIPRAEAGEAGGDLPIVTDYSANGEPCAVCGSRATELHHWAPRHLFGDDCWHWPTAPLCKRHHREWHDRVTPGMAQRAPQERRGNGDGVG